MNTPPWTQIDTLLLDMDGTLLDLSFDNWFWLQHFPQAYADHHQLPLDTAKATLHQIMEQNAGTLHWYSLDFWQQQTGLNVAAIKRAVSQHIAYRPQAEAFLSRLRLMSKRLILTTNAHPDTLRIKVERTGLDHYFDALISSHDYGAAKEDAHFFSTLEREQKIVPSRCFFLDDSLPVLESARAYGIGFSYAIRQPDSTKEPRQDNGFPMVNDLLDLLP